MHTRVVLGTGNCVLFISKASGIEGFHCVPVMINICGEKNDGSETVGRILLRSCLLTISIEKHCVKVRSMRMYIYIRFLPMI